MIRMAEGGCSEIASSEDLYDPKINQQIRNLTAAVDSHSRLNLITKLHQPIDWNPSDLAR